MENLNCREFFFSLVKLCQETIVPISPPKKKRKSCRDYVVPTFVSCTDQIPIATIEGGRGKEREEERKLRNGETFLEGSDERPRKLGLRPARLDELARNC